MVPCKTLLLATRLSIILFNVSSAVLCCFAQSDRATKLWILELAFTFKLAFWTTFQLSFYWYSEREWFFLPFLMFKQNGSVILSRNSALKMNLKNDLLCPALSLCAHYCFCVRLKEDFAVLHPVGTSELMPWHNVMGQPWCSLWGCRLECSRLTQKYQGAKQCLIEAIKGEEVKMAELLSR